MLKTGGYHMHLAAAYVRGVADKAQANSGLITSADGEINGRRFALPPELSNPPLEALTDAERRLFCRRAGRPG